MSDFSLHIKKVQFSEQFIEIMGKLIHAWEKFYDLYANLCYRG